MRPYRNEYFASYDEDSELHSFKNKGRVRRFGNVCNIEFIGASGKWILAPILIILGVTVFNVGFIIEFYSTLGFGLTLLVFISYILLLTTLIWTGFTDPGHLARTDKQDELVYSCEICNTIDEDDVRHCGACGICIKGYDHHCIVVGNCIGEKNITGFYLMGLMFVFNFGVLAVILGVMSARDSIKI